MSGYTVVVGGMIMPRPRKYKDLYGAQKTYRQTEKGRETVRRYNATEAARVSKRDWKRKHDGTIVDRKQHFIDTYGDIETALELLDEKERLVITRLHGLDGSSSKTQEMVATEMRCSQPTVAKLKKKAEDKLAPLEKNIEGKNYES